MAKDRFGVIDKKCKQKKTHRPYNRQQRIANIRKEQRELTKIYKKSTMEEQGALKTLRDDLRAKLQKLRAAERTRRTAKERNKKRLKFIQNPFGFTKQLLTTNIQGRLQGTQKEVEDYLRHVHDDENRDTPLPHNGRLLDQPPSTPFNESVPTLKEVKDVIKKARAASAPGSNGITYKVYKNCPRLTVMLWKIIQKVWKRGEIVASWKQAEGCFIPKKDEATTVDQFRTISLLNVEGKICLAVLATRITQFWLDNKYIDTSVQKGGVPGVSGCLEHTSAVSQQIQEAKENHGDLAILWLDLANAYGSIPHKLVELTLKKYHIPQNVQHLLKQYFDGFYLRFTTRDFTTNWQRLEVGIVTGCTISVILFSGAMNLLMKSVEKYTRGPMSRTGISQPPTRGFMDDMTITCKTVVEARWTLEKLGEMITWARMKFKPAKSRSLVLKSGKLTNRYKFKIQGDTIPTLSDNPVKALGKWYRPELNDQASMKETQDQLRTSMNLIGKSGLPGRYKAWIYQHGVLPRIVWPLMVYEFPLTTVEAMERVVHGYIKKWIGIPKSFSSVGLYSVGNKLQLPFSSLVDVYKTTKARTVTMLKDSSDTRINQAGITVKTGRKWEAEQAVCYVEERLRHKDLVGTTTVGRQGLGLNPRNRWSMASKPERRQLVQDEIRQQAEEERQVKAASMRKQGSWLNWENIKPKKITWDALWKMEPNRTKFLLKAVYDLLPSPSNLCLWKLSPDPNCTLCTKPASLKHILSGCSVSLQQGRYRWRHDQTLAVIAHHLELSLNKQRGKKPTNNTINFVKAGQYKPVLDVGIIHTANDWQMLVYLRRKLVIPPDIAVTTLRPDIGIISRSSRNILLLELTVPWEENSETAHEMKTAKYQELCEEIRSNGWKVTYTAIEVGCRGFSSHTLWSAMKVLGIRGRERRGMITEVDKRTMESSNWIWMMRDDKQWQAVE